MVLHDERAARPPSGLAELTALPFRPLAKDTFEPVSCDLLALFQVSDGRYRRTRGILVP